MTTQNFTIGTIKDGIRKDSKPHAQPDDSFEVLTNAYQWRDRVIRRSGYKQLGRLANGTPVMGLRTQEDFGIGQQSLIAFDTTDAYKWNGTIFIPLPSVMPVTWSGTDYQFFFTTNYANAFWATNGRSGLHGVAITSITNAVAPGALVTTLTPHGFTTGQTVVFINVGGMIEINGQSDTITVTGPTTFTLDTIDTSLYGVYTTGGMVLNSQVSVSGQDGIRYYGILSNGTGWANYNPPIDPNNALAGALLIFAYRGYLVFLNTTEGNEAGTFNYGNRARWTQIGTPYYSEPVPVFPNRQGVDINAARDDLFGRGGANDAPTNEVIVSAGFIRDILVVYFERSTWRLRFVNNAQNPFVWERVNNELGSDCTFSAITFDKGLMSIGNRGIVISDGNDTSRFDEKIPDTIFDIRQNNFGLERVYGIRTFRTKLLYWTYPDSQCIPNITDIYPNKVLVFNYETKNWSFFDDSFTCFGYFYPSGNALTWGDLPDAWSSYTNISWNSGVSQTGFESVVAGNQQGYVLQLEINGMQNDPSLSISAIVAGVVRATFTSTNYNLNANDWITLSGVTGTTSDDGVSLNGRNFKVSQIDANNFSLTEFTPIDGGSASGTGYSYDIEYTNIIPGSIQINVGSLVFFDTDLNGILYESSNLGTGIISYKTGGFSLSFNPAIAPSSVSIRLVTLDPLQGSDSPVNTTGVYGGGGEIAKISGIDIQTKYFNFFNDDKRARLSKVDFYVDSTENGQFTCNVFGDSGNIPINQPLSDNPESNVVLTTNNPYQIGQGIETIYRLYCDAIAQTIQLQLTFSDAQMAVNAINRSDIQILALMFSMRRGGRLV